MEDGPKAVGQEPSPILWPWLSGPSIPGQAVAHSFTDGPQSLLLHSPDADPAWPGLMARSLDLVRTSLVNKRVTS